MVEFGDLAELPAESPLPRVRRRTFRCDESTVVTHSFNGDVAHTIKESTTNQEPS
jgi:hypothetical protein